MKLSTYRPLIAAFLCTFAGLSASAVVTPLANIPGAGSTSHFAINNAGFTAGSYASADFSVQTSFIMAPDGSYTTFSLAEAGLPNVSLTQIRSINNAGDVVGYGRYESAPGNFIDQSFLRTADGTVTLLTDPATGIPLNFSASGINDAGTIVGSSGFAGVGTRSYIRAADGSLQILPSLGVLRLRGINNNGTLTGATTSGGVVLNADLTTRVVLSPPDSFNVFLYGTNDAETYTGGFYFQNSGPIRSFVYDLQNDTYRYFDEDLPEAATQSSQLFGMNSLGQFVVQSGGTSYLWSPVAAIPEPDTWAMWLAGLAMLGGLQRRRARTTEM